VTRFRKRQALKRPSGCPGLLLNDPWAHSLSAEAAPSDAGPFPMPPSVTAVHRFRRCRPPRLQPLNRTPDPVRHHASVDLAGGQEIGGCLSRGVATAQTQMSARSRSTPHLCRCRSPK
jgi:hypothetical protein